MQTSSTIVSSRTCQARQGRARQEYAGDSQGTGRGRRHGYRRRGRARRDLSLAFDGGEVTLTGDDVLIETSSAEGYACAEDVGYLTALDTTLSEELMDEGMAREIVRSVQDAENRRVLRLSDRITLGVSGSAAAGEGARGTSRLRHGRDFGDRTGWSGRRDPLFLSAGKLGDEQWRIEIAKSRIVAKMTCVKLSKLCYKNRTQVVERPRVTRIFRLRGPGLQEVVARKSVVKPLREDRSGQIK